MSRDEALEARAWAESAAEADASHASDVVAGAQPPPMAARAVSEPVTPRPASQELLRHMLESVRDYAIFMLDPQGRVTSWNLGAQRIKGYTAAEIIGKHFSVFYPESDTREAKCELELIQAAREGRFEEEGWRVRKDGSRFWANVVINAVRDEKAELLGFSKITRDLSERKRVQEEQAARYAAEQASLAKDAFLAVLGHELRNPLAPMLTALQLMKLRGDKGTTRERQILERQVKHMIRLVDDLLDSSRISRGELVLKRQCVDVRDIVADAVEVASPMFEQREQRFSVDVPMGELLVDADEARLTQVFANLLVNSAKYTEVGGNIGVRVWSERAEVVVEVEDDGIGIEPEQLTKIFELFVQAGQPAERPAGGLGIGLALVQTLVSMHGGNVEAHSRGRGKGSTFTVRLPVAEGVDASPVKSTAAGRPSPPLLPGARRILLVDDNADALFLLSEVLTATGHEVVAAGDASAALERVRTFVPEVAILDIGLPVIDGYALAQRLREQLGDAAPRLIALSGYGQQSDRERSRQAGFHAHLVKPIDTRRLLDVIAAVGS